MLLFTFPPFLFFPPPPPSPLNFNSLGSMFFKIIHLLHFLFLIHSLPFFLQSCFFHFFVPLLPTSIHLSDVPLPTCIWPPPFEMSNTFFMHLPPFPFLGFFLMPWTQSYFQFSGVCVPWLFPPLFRFGWILLEFGSGEFGFRFESFSFFH